MNKVILIGHIGQDPEIRHTPSGASVIKFSLATNEKVKEEIYTQWHQVEIWNRENIFEHLRKGQKIVVEGKIIYNKYEEKIYTIIRAEKIEFCSYNNKQPAEKPKENEGDMPF